MVKGKQTIHSNLSVNADRQARDTVFDRAMHLTVVKHEQVERNREEKEEEDEGRPLQNFTTTP